MNLIINYIIWLIILYLFFLSFINGMDNNPIKCKLYIFLITFIIQLIINFIDNMNCNNDVNKLIKKSMLYGLFNIIGYSIYIDLDIFIIKDYFMNYNNIYIKYLLITLIITTIGFILSSLDIIITNNIYNECNDEKNKII